MEMNIQMALDNGQVPGISLDDFDTTAPLNINDEVLCETTETPDPRPRGVFTSTSLQLLLLKSLPTRISMLQSLNSVRSTVAYLDIIALSNEITQACQEDAIFFKTNELQPQLTAFHRNLLNYMVRRFLMPLHFPFADQAPANPLLQYSVDCGVNAAIAIVYPEHDDHFHRLLTMSSGMFKESIRYASALLCWELMAQARKHGTSHLLHHEAHCRAYLENAIKELTVLSMERIKMGETNIKLPVFLDMYVANAEAMATGESPLRKIAESANKRLRTCLDELRSQAEVSDASQDTIFTTLELMDGDYGADWDLSTFLGGMAFG